MIQVLFEIKGQAKNNLGMKLWYDKFHYSHFPIRHVRIKFITTRRLGFAQPIKNEILKKFH